MRVAGISTLDAANRFLAEYWVPFWNERFTVEPLEALGAHRPLRDRRLAEGAAQCTACGAAGRRTCERRRRPGTSSETGCRTGMITACGSPPTGPGSGSAQVGATADTPCTLVSGVRVRSNVLERSTGDQAGSNQMPPPNLRAGQARPSDQRVHYHPTPSVRSARLGGRRDRKADASCATAAGHFICYRHFDSYPSLFQPGHEHERG